MAINLLIEGAIDYDLDASYLHALKAMKLAGVRAAMKEALAR